MQERIEEKEIEYMRGKVAGHPVLITCGGEAIVNKGDVITDDVINRAREAGQIHYLMLAAVQSVADGQGTDIDQRMREFGDVTLQHEIDYIRGKVVNRDVMDWNGNVIARSGESISDDMISQARQANSLQNLVLAVGAAGLEEAA